MKFSAFSNRPIRPRVYFMDEFDKYYTSPLKITTTTPSKPRSSARRRLFTPTKAQKKQKSVKRAASAPKKKPMVRPVSRKPRHVIRKAPAPAAAPAVVAPIPAPAPVVAPVFAPAPVAAPAPAFVNPFGAAAPALQPFEPIPAELLDDSAWKASENLDDGIFLFPARLAAESPVPSVEICFSFDTTGSMSCFVEEVKRSVEQIVRQLLGDLPEIRIAIMAHGDYCDFRKFVLRRLDLSNEMDAICHFIKEVEETFGGDREECYELVLREAQNLSWTPGSAKALVVIGDSAPHQPNEYKKLNWEEEVEKLRAMGVKVYGVRCGSKDAFYEEIAERTGGTLLEIARFPEIVEIVMGLCYLEASERAGRERRMREVNLEAMQVDGEPLLLTEAEVEAADQNGDERGPERIFELPEASTSPAAESSAAGPSTSAAAAEDDVMLDEADAMRIHFAIHCGQPSVEVGGKEFPISVGKAGCRMVRIGRQTFVEQNKDKRGSKYAKWAVEGRKITWIIRSGKWGLIMGEQQTEVSEKEAKVQSGVN